MSRAQILHLPPSQSALRSPSLFFLQQQQGPFVWSNFLFTAAVTGWGRRLYAQGGIWGSLVPWRREAGGWIVNAGGDLK